MGDLLWSFGTKRFYVRCTAECEDFPDTSWDETGETDEKLESGEWVIFCAKVAVYLDGHEIAADYLGNCIYADPAEFVTAHRDPNPMNRNCSIMRAASGNVCICHYFPDMVRTVVSEARKAMANVPRMRVA